MSPPIRDGSGSSIGSIRLGDGSEIAEVRTGAGDVLFSAAIPIPASGVARWTFDNADTNSGTAIDSFDNNNGTINGATTGVSGANQTHSTNEAYSFDGSDDSMTVSHNSNLSLKDFSLACWVNPDTIGLNDSLIGKRVGGGDSNYIFRLKSNGEIGLGYHDTGGSFNGDVLSTGTISTGVWSHIIVTHDDSTGQIDFYINGSASGTSSLSNSPKNGSAPLTIGAGGRGGNHFAGDMDDVRIYNKPLSDTEASNLYNSGRI